MARRPRTWFTARNTAGFDIDNSDRIILNRVARQLARLGMTVDAALLIEIRETYQPGMSAADVINAIDTAHAAKHAKEL